VSAVAVRALVTPLASFILRQDAWVLDQQTANIRRFGGERYASTRIDILGPHIWRLLRRAERGDVGHDEDDGGDERPRRDERLTLRL
jgi:hypothetical protein